MIVIIQGKQGDGKTWLAKLLLSSVLRDWILIEEWNGQDGLPGECLVTTNINLIGRASRATEETA